MDEPEWLPVILSLLGKQNFSRFTLVVCINQPDAWWDDPSTSALCETNALSLALLNGLRDFRIEVIDKSSKGAGWTGKRHGVGWARKTIMDHISREAGPTDILLSLDADTVFSENYLGSVAETLAAYPKATALSVPYFHPLPEDRVAARAILRYEIYMRYYVLNLWRIRSPYAFTALGSAMAVPVWAYRKVGGMTPKRSGEDFYFLQKLRKAGGLICRNSECVFPAARFSSRVFFGTGPAMIRGAQGDWKSYPIYPFRLFDEIGESYLRFHELYSIFTETSVTRFLQKQTGDEDPFETLRKNATDVKQFVKACHEKFDGLRILQFLKQRQKEVGGLDEENLTEWLEMFCPGFQLRDKKSFSFTESSIEELDELRNFLFWEEEKSRESDLLLR